MHWTWIFMGDKEWSSDENYQIMPNLAKRHAKEHPDMLPLAVEVWEHGGWYHLYYFDEENRDGVLVGTASMQSNDERAQALLKKYYHTPAATSETIRR
jgi:hypothetical protein